MEPERIKSKIRNYLTLRYDYMNTPLIRHTNYKNWIPTIYETTALSLEKKLLTALSYLKKYNKIGISLSSGIDSVLLLRLIRHLFPEKKIIAFHYLGKPYELEDAAIYAKAWANEFVTIRNYSLFEKLQWMVQATKEPTWDAFDYLIPLAAHERGCDCLVSGWGADELFGGYTFRYTKFMPIDNNPISKFNAYMNVHNRDWVDDQEHLFGPEIKFEWAMIKDQILHYFANPLGPLNQIFMADFNGKLVHNFLYKSYSFGQMYQIDMLVPYLDANIMEYAMHLEPELKVAGEIGQIPLRQIAARYDVAVDPKKKGMGHDVVKDWNGHDHDEAEEDLTNPKNEIFTRGYISFDWVNRHCSGKDRYDVRYVNKFMHLLALEEWLRRYG